MLEKYTNIFIVGIKGVAMTNLAKILTKLGKKVSGSDTAESFITDGVLMDSDIIVLPSFAPMLLPENTELVIYSAAHEGKENQQVKEAIHKGMAVMHQAEVMRDLLSEFESTIAVAGCHGKTTTSSLLAFALKKMDQKPSYLVGVSEFSGEIGGEYNDKKYFVVEADEYAMDPPADKTPKFLLLQTDHAIITNIDFDHPDVYKDLEETKKAFHTFIENILEKSEKSRIAVCIDDENLKEVVQKFPRDKFITYGFAEEADCIVSEVKTNALSTLFTIKHKSLKEPVVFSIKLFGEKNISNAAGVISLLLHLGFEPQYIAKAIEGFSGARRRFELLEQKDNLFLFDDYAHHPNEIKATIQAARVRFPQSKVIVLFQPHTYSRTKELKDNFIDALKEADVSVLLPIFASAREERDESISSKSIVEEANKQGSTNLYSLEYISDLVELLRPHMTENTVIFTMGAGDVYKLQDKISPLLHQIGSI